MEKNELMPLMFTPDDLDLMRRMRAAFNPAGRLNPGKVLPLGKGLRRNSRATDAGFRDNSRMSHPAQASLTRLEEIVGGAHVITDPAEIASRQVDDLRPSAVVQPADAAQVAEIIRFAAAEKLALIPCGGCTKLGIGSPPARYDIALDLSRMNRVLAYDPRDLTLGVEPGVRIEDLLRVPGGTETISSARGSIRRSRDHWRHRRCKFQFAAAPCLRRGSGFLSGNGICDRRRRRCRKAAGAS